MKSPFPGMDPFLEVRRLWEDFHDSLIGDLKNALTANLPDPYFVSVGQRFYVVQAVVEDERTYGGKPDVAVGIARGVWRPANAPDPALAVAEPGPGPLVIDAFVEEAFTELFLEIRELADEKLVTSLEILSPTNKQFDTEGWKQYQRKRQGCLKANDVNFVELDLLRGGQRQPMQGAWPESPYYVLVNRRRQGLRCEISPAFSLQPLPPLTIPLLPPDNDIVVDLQALVDGIYERSRYGRRIDYRKPPRPNLDSAESAWLEERLAE